MKVYEVYVNGVLVRTIKAASHNAAEVKARKLYPNVEPHAVSVAYTEV